MHKNAHEVFAFVHKNVMCRLALGHLMHKAFNLAFPEHFTFPEHFIRISIILPLPRQIRVARRQ